MTKRQFRLTAAKAEQPAIVTATGDIDLANVEQFSDVMASAAADSSAITVDLSGVSYCDSSGVRVLFSVAAITKLALIVPANGPITTLLRISGLDRIATVTTVD